MQDSARQPSEAVTGHHALVAHLVERYQQRVFVKSAILCLLIHARKDEGLVFGNGA